MRNCYTYLIGWASRDMWYYGVRYAIGCKPSDLWVTYFTSSTFVARTREMFGEPDVVQVRNTYGNNAKLARHCEDKVLRRMNVVGSSRWLNRSMNNSFCGSYSSWNEGLTKDTSASLMKAGMSISASRKIKPSPGWLGKTKSKDQCEENAWAQIIKHSPSFRFASYDELKLAVIELTNQGLGAYAVATQLKVDGSSIINMLKREGIRPKPNQSWTKIKARYPHFRFVAYDDFCEYCKSQVAAGTSIYKLTKELGLTNGAIKTALN